VIVAVEAAIATQKYKRESVTMTTTTLIYQNKMRVSKHTMKMRKKMAMTANLILW